MSTESRILIGYWNDHENNYPQYPMPVGESVLDINMYKFHEMVADYLDSGYRVNQYRGISVCRIDAHGNGTCERCDDKYVWPEGLGHYVRDHHIILPDEFIDHIVANEYVIPLSHQGSLVVHDKTFWLDWASTGKAPKPVPDLYKSVLSGLTHEIQSEIDKDILANLRKYRTNPSPEISKLIDSVCDPNNHMLDD